MYTLISVDQIKLGDCIILVARDLQKNFFQLANHYVVTKKDNNVFSLL
jgi:hypothetical protein